ncbi:MAG: hypothetical protein ACPHX8_08800, partial [Candidatus Poseidoniaceae archaeon]
MSPAPARVDRYEEEDFHIVAESWLIDRYNLGANLTFVEYLEAEGVVNEMYANTNAFNLSDVNPDYVVRLLPYLREHCQDEDEQLDPSKFRDVLIILNTISLFYQEDELIDA